MEIKILVKENQKKYLENFIEVCKQQGFIVTHEGGGKIPNWSGWFAELKGERWQNTSEQQSICNLPQVSKSLPTDTEMLDWIQMILTPKENYCEVFFAGLRSGSKDAEAYQIESNPQKFETLQAKNIREVIFAAMVAYNKDR
mgnify:CR=1 FL=1